MINNLQHTNKNLQKDLIAYNRLKNLDVKDEPWLELARLYAIYSKALTALSYNVEQLRHKALMEQKDFGELFAKLDNRLCGYKNNLVFVYGTLKQGGQNLKGAKLLGRAHTTGEYSMYGKGLPHKYITKKSSLNMHKVYGEVYEVNDTLLAHLDAFVGVDDFCYRIHDNVKLVHDNKIISAYVYFMNNTVEPIDEWE